MPDIIHIFASADAHLHRIHPYHLLVMEREQLRRRLFPCHRFLLVLDPNQIVTVYQRLKVPWKLSTTFRRKIELSMNNMILSPDRYWLTERHTSCLDCMHSVLSIYQKAHSCRYFTNCHPNAPFLDVSLDSDPNRVRLNSTLLLLAILSVGARFWSASSR